MPKPAVIAVAAVAFLMPVAIVTYQHREGFERLWEVDPQRGQLLFFTSPS
jgi:hypothetical protein